MHFFLFLWVAHRCVDPSVASVPSPKQKKAGLKSALVCLRSPVRDGAFAWILLLSLEPSFHRALDHSCS